MVQRVAPISAFLALMIIPSSCAIRHAIATKTEQRVDDRIRQLQRLALQVRETSSFDWSRMEDSPDAASRAVETLRGLSVPTSKGENELWRSAASLHKDDELVAAMDGVTEEVVGAFNPERVPRVSTLREPALRWEHPSRRWIPYSQFPVLSEIAGTYHQELGRLFAELAPQSIGRDQPAAVEYQRHYQQRRELLRSYLNDTAGSWTDNWAAFRVPHHDELIGRNDAPLREVLQAPFVSGPYGKLSSGQFFRLMSLPLSTAKSITGCDEGARPAHAPGCHCHDYAEGSFSYFRVDCYSYVPRKEATGADLRVELRLVYQSRYRKGLLANELPNELFFHFLLPPGAEESAFREEVMTALSTAARVFQPRAIQRSKDRSGSVASGFTLRQKGETLDIVSKLVPLQGLVPERKALLVRVFRPGFGSAL
ncbi:MAG: hypothetical protein JOZ54_19260 [Acidobacteria bacterium]|nr:hypothetical protein [Acidobacteriota bacterium]